MREDPHRSVAALGDVLDPNCFGGAPYQFFRAAKARGFAGEAWRVDLPHLRRDRLLWNLGRVATGHRPGGFQFTAAGRKAALARSNPELLATEVISFHQHVPPAAAVAAAGGTLNFYIDATYAQLFAVYGLDRALSAAVRRQALDYEREAFAAARRIVTCQTWALRSLVDDYGIPAEKCAAILPAPNYPTYPGIRPRPEGAAGRDRPFVIGFIGKDWRRKGLKILVEAAAILRRSGAKVTVRAIGFVAEDCPYRGEVECLGFIDKQREFGPFLHSCDLGCLFSSAEALGTAILEFLGVGVPVAGFTVNGLADALPAGASFRFPGHATPEEIAEAFRSYLGDESRQESFRAQAIRLADSLTWERCVGEFEALWANGRLEQPFRLWEAA
jgi:glycosyltransferase involved in cell wall biosynthesis